MPFSLLCVLVVDSCSDWLVGGGFRTGRMDVIATGVPKFRLVADFILLWMEVWEWVCIYYQLTWTGGWLVNFGEGLSWGWSVGTQICLLWFLVDGLD